MIWSKDAWKVDFWNQQKPLSIVNRWWICFIHISNLHYSKTNEEQQMFFQYRLITLTESFNVPLTFLFILRSNHNVPASTGTVLCQALYAPVWNSSHPTASQSEQRGQAWMRNCRHKRDCFPCDYTGKLVSKWEINSTSLSLLFCLFQHTTLQYMTVFFLFYFLWFGGLIRLGLTGKFQLDITGNVFC